MRGEEVELSADDPPVLADRERIRQVLDSLLSHAAHHSPGSVPIRIGAVRQGAHVSDSVVDEDGGSASEKLSRLFREYASHPDEVGGKSYIDAT